MRINVECQRREGEEAVPCRFFLGKRPVEVTEVLDRWLGHDNHYFKVQGDDGAIYLLRHDRDQWAWNLTMFATSGAWNTELRNQSTTH